MPDNPCLDLLCHGFLGPGGLHPHGDCLSHKTGDTPSNLTALVIFSLGGLSQYYSFFF